MLILKLLKNLISPICLQIEDGHHRITYIKQQHDSYTIVEIAGFLPEQRPCVVAGDRLTIMNKFDKNGPIIYKILFESQSDANGKAVVRISPAITLDEAQRRVTIFKRIN